MATEFKLPELGENIKSGTVTKVLVAVGDIVKKEQPLLEMETDKAIMELPSSMEGKVLAVHVKAGEQVAIGQLIFTLESQDTPPAEPAAKPEEKKAGKQAPPPTTVPPPAISAAENQPAIADRTNATPVTAAPSVRLLARELGIDISRVPGAGPNGRISIEDVKAFAKQMITSPSRATAPTVPLPDFSRWGAVELQAMNNVRRITAEHMAMAWTTIPHVTHFDQANITDLEERRKKLAPKAEAAGGKLTMTAILAKVVAAALKVFPKFNASLDMAKSQIVLKKFYAVGVAVDTERGLLVPVIRDADKKNIVRISSELVQMAEKARTGKINPDDLQGGTFTITNLGGIGGGHFTPIINFPEVAILGVGRARLEPTFNGKDGCCQPRLMLPLSLSYDHRLIDGAEAARFMRWIVEAMEEPLMIPLEG